MTAFADPQDRQLDAEWRARFGQPLPILGCAELVRQVLAASPPTGDRAPSAPSSPCDGSSGDGPEVSRFQPFNSSASRR